LDAFQFCCQTVVLYSGWLIGFRQGYGKNTATARLTLDLDGAVVLFDDLAGDGQTKPDAAKQVVANPVYPVKTIVDMR
jgi:hypothetical protein